MEIGEVARRVGLKPSAVRYYEERGLIAPEQRVGNRRVYNEDAVARLSLILFAKELGFSLDDIRTLLDGFPEGTKAGERWAHLASIKLAQLDVLSQRIERVRDALQRISRCGCKDLDECSRYIAAKKR
jgi:MerR family redox-sensitive transcriptional activator SoxR